MTTVTEQPSGLPDADEMRVASRLGDITFAAAAKDGGTGGELREFTALILPWGTATSDGRGMRFNDGSVTWAEEVTRVKLLAVHDRYALASLVGKAIKVWSTPEGLRATFALGSDADADKVWTKMQDGLLDGVSVGVTFSTYDGFVLDEDTGDIVVTGGAVLRETSLVPIPAFDDARTEMGASVIAAFAASTSTTNHTNKGANMGNENTPAEQTSGETAPVVARFDQDALTAALKAGNADFAATLAESIVAGLKAGQAVEAAGEGEGLAAAVPGRAVVTERPEYGFGAAGSVHSFTRDLALRGRNEESAARIAKFEGQLNDGTVNFAQVRADVAALSPTQPRQDLYVDQLAFATPLWDAVTNGTLSEITPFVLPKWVSAAGLSGDHTEGTNPTSGTITLTTQTITPFAISGSYQASREAFEAGSPQLDQIVLRAMILEYEQDREAKIAATLAAVSLTGAHAQVIDSSDNVTAGVGDGEVVSDKIAAVLIDQLYARGGTRIDRTVMGQTPYTALINAKDADRRPMFPGINPTNAVGSRSRGVAALNVHEQIVVPAPALSAATGYSFSSESVYSWASPVRQFRFEERLGVANIELAIFGYQANAVLRDADVYRYTVQA